MRQHYRKQALKASDGEGIVSVLTLINDLLSIFNFYFSLCLCLHGDWRGFTVIDSGPLRLCLSVSEWVGGGCFEWHAFETAAKPTLKHVHTHTCGRHQVNTLRVGLDFKVLWTVWRSLSAVLTKSQVGPHVSQQHLKAELSAADGLMTLEALDLRDMKWKE